MKLNFYLNISVFFLVSFFLNTGCKNNEPNSRQTVQISQTTLDSLNALVSELKSHCYYSLQYRYLLRDGNTKKIVAGVSPSYIYCVEIGYGMGSVDYVYFKNDIDDVPEIVSCIRVNWGIGDQFEYEILDNKENIIEHQIFIKEKGEKLFEQKMEKIFEGAQKKALKYADVTSVEIEGSNESSSESNTTSNNNSTQENSNKFSLGDIRGQIIEGSKQEMIRIYGEPNEEYYAHDF
jgi:hypothetical protein